MWQTDLAWLNVFPEGMEKIVNYIKERYNNTPMYITENGESIKMGANQPCNMKDAFLADLT